jgi:hypothetical protein
MPEWSVAGLGPITCKKCGHTDHDATVANYLHSVVENDDGSSTITAYDVWICPACSDFTIDRKVHDVTADSIDWRVYAVLPVPDSLQGGLPESVSKALMEASSISSVNANAYATMLGRVLDAVCVDRGANGKTLYDKLAVLSKRGELPQRLVDLANHLREFRNIGAHADLGTLEPEDVAILEPMVRAILEYVYRLPALIEYASRRLNALRHQPTNDTQDT